MSIATVRINMKMLVRVNEECGGNGGKERSKEPQVDTTNMSAYDRGQFEAANLMKRIREGMTQMEQMQSSGSGSNADRIRIANSVRQQHQQLQRDSRELKDCARRENKLDQYDQLMYHVNKTHDMYRSRDGKKREGSESDRLSGKKPGGGYGATGTFEMSARDGPTMSITDDPEFQQFMTQVHQNDQRMDEALDVISAGLQRLNKTAQNIGQELKKQDVLLNDIEKDVDMAGEELETMNKKMKKIVNSVKKDACCMYIICFLLILGIVGAIIAVVKV